MFPPFEAEKLTPDLENEIREFGHKFLHYPDDYCKQACRDILTLLSEIDSLRSRLSDLEAKNRWIPVQVRLPKKEGIYLIYDPYRYGVQSEWWHGHVGDTWRYVTHWMPLPKPPKEKA